MAVKAKTLTDKLQQLPVARREQVEARAAELVAEAAHNRDVKGAAMTPEQMKQRAAEIVAAVEADLSECGEEKYWEWMSDYERKSQEDALAILRAVAGGVIGEYEPDVVLLHDETPTDWPVGCSALVIQGGEE